MTVEEEYRKAEGLNQSLLKKIAIGPAEYKREEEKRRKAHFIKGGALDCLLTTPTDFDSRFYVMTAEVPTDQMVKYVYALLEGNSEEDAKVISGYKNIPSGKNWEDKGKPFYEDLQKSKGKQALGFSEYSTVKKMESALRTGIYTAKYFNIPAGDDVEVNYQMDIYWEIEGEKCKSLLDIVYIDHVEKTITPLDVKSDAQGIYKFERTIAKYGYYIQGAFYTDALKWYIANVATELKDYKILNFQFIVADSNAIDSPIIYELSDRDLDFGRNGGIDQFQRDIKGYLRLIDDYKWHRDNDEWVYTRQVVEGKGVISTKIFV